MASFDNVSKINENFELCIKHAFDFSCFFNFRIWEKIEILVDFVENLEIYYFLYVDINVVRLTWLERYFNELFQLYREQ